MPERPDTDVADAVRQLFPEIRRRLEDLVRVPSVSLASHDAGEVRRCAELALEQCAEVGLRNGRLLELDGCHPYVYADWLDAGPDAPTVLLYAHYDVQPTPAPERWLTPPFEPTERDGRLHGRGTSDDKGGLAIHLGAIQAWLEARGHLPVNVKVLSEGEEEIGSPHIEQCVERYRDVIDADVVVVADSGNWKTGWPGLTFMMRGIAEVHLKVRALESGIHSGIGGGIAPDPVLATIKALATLTDEKGEPAVPGLADDVRPLSDDERARIAKLVGPTEPRFGALPEVTLAGDRAARNVYEQLWAWPAITVIGIELPRIADSVNLIQADCEAKVSIRLAPGQDPARASRLVAEHLERNVPPGFVVETRAGAGAPAFVADPTGPAVEACLVALEAGFEHESALMGMGGTQPVCGPLSSGLGAACLMTGVGDHRSKAHAQDESMPLDDLLKATLAEAYLFSELAARSKAVVRT